MTIRANIQAALDHLNVNVLGEALTYEGVAGVGVFDVELVDDENDASGLWHVWRGRILLPKATFPMVEDLKTLTRTEDGAKFTISKPTDGRLGYWICQAVGRVQHKRGTL